MLDSINDLRKNDAWYWDSANTEKIWQSDLQPLVYDYALERVAMQRAAELAIMYDHVRPNGKDCFTAYPNELRKFCGENIAFGYKSADSVFEAWAEADKSYGGQGHRRNMLEAGFRSVGIGCFRCGDTLFWAQAFSDAVTNSAPSPLTVPVNVKVHLGFLDYLSFADDHLSIPYGKSSPLQDIRFTVRGLYCGCYVPCTISGIACQTADAGIVRISDGMLFAVGEGETTLTATLSNLSAVVTISVRPDQSIPLSLDVPREVSVSAGKTLYFGFIPEKTDRYTFSSSGSCDTLCELYDIFYNRLDLDDDTGSGYNFSLTHELTAGRQYYYGVKLWSDDSAGSFTVTLQKAPEPTQGFSYKVLSDGTASITGCSASGDIVIPETIDGYTVTNLAARLFYNRSGITSVTIPATVTYFGENKADNNWDYVFSYCYDLKSINVDRNNPIFLSVSGILFTDDGETLLNFPCNFEWKVFHVIQNKIACTAFAGCRNLKFLFIDNPNTTWSTYTFYNTHDLTVFYLDGGMTARKVSDEVAAGHVYENSQDPCWCRLVNKAEIRQLPAQLEKIESEAFRGTDIRYLNVPYSCRRIEKGAFTGSSLSYLHASQATVIENGALDASVVVDLY